MTEPSGEDHSATVDAPTAEERQLPASLQDAYDSLDPVPQTGDPRVDDATTRLGELGQLPVEEHLEVFQDVHRRLHGALADLDVS